MIKIYGEGEELVSRKRGNQKLVSCLAGDEKTMKILNLTEREATPIQKCTGLYEPKPEDGEAIKKIIELKEKIFSLLRDTENEYPEEGSEIFTVLIKKLVAIAQKYGTLCMIGCDPFVGRCHRSLWTKEIFLKRTFLDALEKALKEVGITPMYSLTWHATKPLRTRVVKEDEKDFRNSLDDEIIDRWEYTQGAEKKGIKRVNQVRIDVTQETETIKWYAVK